MTLVSGPLSTVTTTPSAVSQVNVSINSPRTRGAGVMTPEVKTVAVTGGNFSSQIAPGPAVLTLLIGGRESAPIPILVDDVASQTLAEVVDAARLATGETQESLAQFVQQVLSARTDVLQARDEYVDTFVPGLFDAWGSLMGTMDQFKVDASAEITTAKYSAITDVGTAKNTALTEIEAEVTRAEDAAARAENAVNDGLGDGSVTLQKLAQDVKDQINSKADLVGGKIPTSQIPDVALKKQASVAWGAAMTAVSAYAPVSSVNGQTGTVVLNASDVGAAPTTHTHTVEQITDLPTVSLSATGSSLVQRWYNGNISVPATPGASTDAASKGYVDSRIPAVVRQEVQGTNGATIFEKHGNVVHVISTGTHGGITIPSSFRPVQARRVAVASGSSGTTNTSLGVCVLNPDGSISGGWASNAAFSYLIQ